MRLVTVPDLDTDAINEKHRVHRVERPGLPELHVVDDGVGDPRDCRAVNLLVIHVEEVRGDVASRQALGVERDDHLIEPSKPARTDRHRDWVEIAIAITRHFHSDAANLGSNRFRVVAVARVARPSALERVRFVAEMVGDLGFQRPLQHLLHETGQQAALAGERDAVSVGLIDQALRDQRQAGIGRQCQRRRRDQLDLRFRNFIRFHCSDPSRTTASSCGPDRTTPVTHSLQQSLT